ncbi:Nephrocystin-3, partial [Aduncisulcus paluster]
VLIDDACNGLLCDFEGAVDCGERTLRLISQTMKVGTQAFMAPELRPAFDGKKVHPSPASDMFSFGVLVQDVFGALDGVCMPAEVHSICAACVSEHPRDRPTARQVLTHKWFL